MNARLRRGACAREDERAWRWAAASGAAVALLVAACTLAPSAPQAGRAASDAQAGRADDRPDTRHDAPADTRRSGVTFMLDATRALQDDDSANPAMLAVAEGEALWRAPAGVVARACAGCHADASVSMRGVAARHPRFDDLLQRPIDLATRINLCRTRHQQATPWPAESAPLLALAAYVARQSRGLPLAPDPDPRLVPFRELGAALYRQRFGQLDVACSQCHDDGWGRRLAGSTIPQAHPTAYPLYRLEWQAIGSLQRRLRGCMTGVRAEPWPYGAVELVALELFLVARAAGMPLESPGVRP